MVDVAKTIVGGTATAGVPHPRRVPAWERPFPRSVAVGLNDGHPDYRAFEWAARHAARCGADLQVFCLGPSTAAGAGAALLDNVLVRRVLTSLPLLAAHFRQHDADPVATVSAAASEAAVVVLGTAGPQRPDGPRLSDLVLPVLARCSCDVVVVGGRSEAIRGEYGWITACVDGGDHGDAVLRAAADLCRMRRARLRLLHVRPPHPHGHTGAGSAVPRHASELLRLIAPDVQPVVVTDHRYPHEAVCAYPTDVLVVGAGRSARARGTGPFARTALYHASCPVLITGPGCPARPKVSSRPI